MNTGRLRLGMLSILLTIIVICMGVLSLLSFATSEADLRLAERYAQTVKTRYALEGEGRRYMSENEPVIMDTEIDKDGYKLVIEAGEDNTIISWRIEKIWEENTKIDDLWKGD